MKNLFNVNRNFNINMNNSWSDNLDCTTLRHPSYNANAEELGLSGKSYKRIKS